MKANGDVAKLLFLILEKMGVGSISESELLARLESPKEACHGDIAFPCFVLTKELKKPPVEIAAELVPLLKAEVQKHGVLAQVEQVGPYLNFFVHASALANFVVEVLEGEPMITPVAPSERVMIEYSQPNTHKAFHVGHMRNVALGDALVRMYEYVGHNVTAANYIGDEGAHIAKCLWAYQQDGSAKIPSENRGEFLGGYYRQADELLDFTRLTDHPFPGLIIAQVLSLEAHAQEKKWQVVRVNTGNYEATVVCGGKGFAVGDKVPYVPLGERFGGRLMEERDMKGVVSCGMLCSEKELKCSENKEQIKIFPPEATVGMALTEYGRIKNALPESIQVADEMARRLKEVSDTLKQLEDKSSPIQALWKTTREWSLADFKAIYKWVDCRFDHYFFESEVGDEGKQVVLDALDKGLLVRSEGTVGADLAKYKLGYLMLLKSDGTGLYATKDIALAEKKFKEFKIDRSIYVVDYSQSLHFSQVFKTLEILGYPQASKCYHLAYGLVTVPEGKMSSRKGTVIYFSELKTKLTQYILQEQLAKHVGEWSEAELNEAAHKIAVATIKYGMLNQDNLKNIVFDLNEWTSLTGNTGPYLLYAYARTCSIQRKVGAVDLSLFNGSLLIHSDEHELLAELNRFSDVVLKSVDQNRPQNLCIYLYNLCRCFSRMFENCSVANAEDEVLKMSRLGLVKATGVVLKQGLALLGISTLEKM
jgi:arginyl-tRNA synthetase